MIVHRSTVLTSVQFGWTARVGMTLLVLLVCATPGRGLNSDSISPAGTPLSVLLLMDASGSMRHTDPESLRIAAAQAVVSMLKPTDEVAVAEFDASGRILTQAGGKVWWPATSQNDLYVLMKSIGNP